MSIIAKKFGINQFIETENDINKQLNKYQKDLIFTDRSQVVMDLIMNFLVILRLSQSIKHSVNSNN